MWFANDFHSWLRHTWKLLANHLTRDPKIIIHGNSCIIHYIFNQDNTAYTVVALVVYVYFDVYPFSPVDL